MLLNARQEAFCRCLVEGVPASRAYEQAGYDARNNAAEVNASRLLRNAKVAKRLRELQVDAAHKAAVTAETVAAELDAAYKLAFANRQAAACVAASMGKARLYGLIVDRQELRAEVVRKPAADPNAPTEMSLADWSQKYGGTVIEHQP